MSTITETRHAEESASSSSTAVNLLFHFSVRHMYKTIPLTDQPGTPNDFSPDRAVTVKRYDRQ